ncbi:Signal transduction histidine kinase [Catalinimonas alkaloidigena]|uniref:histidine kinase n=1 Tax=Catalinimonas alkaloidigena TaxID=1075417 RepID=A0A1G9GZS1_9BACT|nr:two-component regulator propeller domain-containing protein [Catalinimonas alkaloidigena]SDL06151.1 Signal transduction histidine kinase [Catalinimonas alkaloidigena]
MVRIILGVVLWAGLGIGGGQLGAQTLYFSTLSVRDGLPAPQTTAIVQDAYGFLWLGTSQGLARYDGYRFQAFPRGDSMSFPASLGINALVAAGDTLWIGTWKGLYKMSVVTFQTTRVDVGAENTIRCLYQDRQGDVWVGSSGGLWHFPRHGGAGQHFTQHNSRLSHNTVRALYQDRTGTLWVGTYDGLNQLAPGASHFRNYDLKGNYAPAPDNNLIGAIQPVSATADSLLWVGTETGLCLFDPTAGTYQHFNRHNAGFSNDVVKSILVAADQRLWLGTDFGLNLFDPRTRTTTTYFHQPQVPHSLPSNVVWQFFEDRGGVRWLATSNGVSRLKPARIAYTFHEVTAEQDGQTIGNQVRDVLVARDGAKWLATLHGVIRIDPTTGARRWFRSTDPGPTRLLLDNAFTLAEDDRGRIWIGTAGGINLWNEATQRMETLTACMQNGLNSNYIGKILRSPEGSFWVVAWDGGLFRVSGTEGAAADMRFRQVDEVAAERSVAGDDALWSIQYNQLFRIDWTTGQKQRIETFAGHARGQEIQSLCRSRTGVLWATTQRGLLEYRPTSDQAVFHPLVMGNAGTLANLLEDDEGNLWGTTPQYLLKYQVTTGALRTFPLEKELPLTSFYNGCATRSATGEFLLGGDNGYLSFFPEALAPDPYRPPVHLTSLQINNQAVATGEKVDGKALLHHDISFTDALHLDYGQRSLAFEFAALDYWQPALNTYAYRLEGFDDDWHYTTGAKNFAVYANLTPGTYTLAVKGTNNFGLWSDQVATLRIHIRPPLLLSPGFLVGYVVLILGAAFAGLRLYTARMKLKNELHIARLERQHAEELVETKQRFFTNLSHELRTPISLILPPIRQVLKQGKLDEASSGLMALAEKNAQRLLRVVNQILDVRKLENDVLPLRVTPFDLVEFCRELTTLFADRAARKQIRFAFRTDLDTCEVWADTEKVETVIYNLLSNAFKFTPDGGSVTLALQRLHDDAYPHDAVSLVVQDTGMGISADEQRRIFERFYQTPAAKAKEPGSGIGLTLVAEYIRLHHGRISVESALQQGSRFTVVLPLGNAHFPVDLWQEEPALELWATKTPLPVPYRYELASDKPLVLIVEDNPQMVDFIRLSLRHKYHFLVAENGEEGLAKATQFSPDVIVSDSMMPVMDGLLFCRKLKESPQMRHIPFLFLTAKSLPTHVLEGIQTGADLYLTKPVDMDLLEAHLDQMIARQQEMLHYFKNEVLLQPAAPSATETVDEKFIKKIMQALEAHLDDPAFSVEVLASEVGLSTTHLYRKLKSLTDLSGNQLIRKYRLRKASLLLSGQAGNVSEAMYATGFTSLSYFSKCFKAEFGLTPKEFQQQAAAPEATEIDAALFSKVRL